MRSYSNENYSYRGTVDMILCELDTEIPLNIIAISSDLDLLILIRYLNCEIKLLDPNFLKRKEV